MPGTPTDRYYFGDFRLWLQGIDHAELPARGVLQEFQGVDQTHGLMIPASSNTTLRIRVRTFGAPNPSSIDRKGFRSVLAQVRAGLVARSLRADPLVWIEDDTVTDTVTSFAGSTITAAGHPFADGDVVLVRRLGVGLWSLATVSAAGAGGFDVTAVGTTTLHAIQPADEIYRVEGYYLGAIAEGIDTVPPKDDGDFYADELAYTFATSGLYTYERTAAATVGS